MWKGQHCVHSMLDAGVQAAARLSRYEGAPAAQVVRQGKCHHGLLVAALAMLAQQLWLEVCSAKRDSAAACLQPALGG